MDSKVFGYVILIWSSKQLKLIQEKSFKVDNQYEKWLIVKKKIYIYTYI